MDNQAALGCIRASADAAVELPLMEIMMMERLVLAKLTDVLWRIVCTISVCWTKIRHWGLSKALMYTGKKKIFKLMLSCLDRQACKEMRFSAFHQGYMKPRVVPFC